MSAAPPPGHAAIADPSLAPTRLPDFHRPIPGPGPGCDPRLDVDPEAATLAARGLRCHITPDSGDGETIGLDGRPASGLPAVAGARVIALGARGVVRERRLRVGGGALVERVAVPWEAPFCLLEWECVEGEAQVELRWRVPPAAAGAIRWHAFDRGLVVSGLDDRRTAFLFDAPPLELRPEPVADGRALSVRASVRLPSVSPVRLAIGAGDGAAGVDRMLRAAARTVAVVRGREAKLDRLGAERLRLTTPAAAVDAGVERAKRLLAASSSRSGRRGDGLVESIARLVIGEGARVREELGRRLAGPAEPRETCLDLILLARYLAWTGDPRPAAEAWERLEDRVRTLLEERAVSGDPPADLRSVALAEMVHVAEAVGRDDRAAELRVAAGPWGAEAGSVGTLRVVPGWTRPIEEWRSILAAGSAARPDSGPAGPSGLPAGGTEPAYTAAERIGAAAFGLVGAEADAPRGRLRIRPRPPAEWDRLAVRGLPLGSASVSVSMARTGNLWRVRARQERGSAPLTLLLEPELPGRLVRARVETRPADLEPAPADGRIRIPLQVILDHERTVELEMEPEPR